jgi:regulation of enolase protein 1 (concanavalin A-like superfamily)
VQNVHLASLPVVGADHGSIRHLPAGAVITAGGGTDAFSPPDGGAAIDRLPGLRLACPDGPWTLAVRVAPRFAAAFDAGALMLRTAEGHWAKLAFERSPDGRAMAVSVVTRGVSDDANGPAFDRAELYLRACWTGTACAFHTSEDGKRWDLLRFFALPGRVVAVDIVAQSPTGAGCEVRVDHATLMAGAPADLRDGS